MPRRHSVAHHACELCRQRKRKCDGDGSSPCKACDEAGAECVYLATARVSKANLREELARLQSINSDNSALLDAISSRNTSPAELNNILQRLSDGHSRAEVAGMITQKPNMEDDFNRGDPSTSVPISESPLSSGTLLSSAHDNSISPNASDATPPTLLSTPETRFRANLGYYRSQLPQLLDTMLTRDCLSFCPINKEEFTRDVKTGFGQNCSSSLLDSLLALATLLAPERLAIIVASLSGDDQQGDIGDAFAQEAIASLYNGTGLPQRIADIQALGILALYCLGCGKMKDGLGFAGDYGSAITEQWATKQSEPIFADRQTYANIYCAAISFNRMLFLIQDYNRTLENVAGKVGMQTPSSYNSSVESTHGNSNLSGSIIDDAFFARDLSQLPNNPKVVAAKIFEFTEWVYKARFRPEEKSFEQTMEVYRNGLQWYESFFAYTTSCSNDMPLILFSQ
ncbi:hypothetical protein PWT90_03267 [Aphanocladium album]|nr:hypothetical protein PWT90_03267 [Aphanocladium album]